MKKSNLIKKEKILSHALKLLKKHNLHKQTKNKN